MSENEKAQVYADRDWWQSAGKVVGLELRGWTFRNVASFVDRDSGLSVEMSGLVAARLIALSRPDGEAIAGTGGVPSVLPCDVAVAPATIIRKGCKVSTLMLAITRREGRDVGEISDAALAALASDAPPIAAAAQGEVKRCLTTGNPVGTDTWRLGYRCPCANCTIAPAPARAPEPAAAVEESDALSQARMLLLAVEANDPTRELAMRVKDLIAALASPATHAEEQL